MEFHILGPLEVLDGDRRVALGGGKRRALLALLLLNRGETLSTDQVIDELWGDNPPLRAAKTVQVHISRLRKALAAGGGDGPEELVVTREHGYELVLDPERVDAHRFELLVVEGRRELAASRPEQAASALEKALSLWRGRPLADLAYEPFAQPEIARMEDVHVAALEHLIDAKLALGRHVEVVGQLEGLIRDHPYREGLRAQLMLALYRCDRQADALQVYQDTRRALVEELGIEPGERLRKLERAVLAHDQALAAPSPPPRIGDDESDDGEGSSLPSASGELPTGVVTFLLTDIESSSRLWEIDAEGMAAALELHDDLIAGTVNGHGGRLLKAKGEGDATLSVFWRASDAVACVVQLQQALASASWPSELDLRVRLAVHSGEAHERAGDYFGHALNRAARLRGLARGGSIVMSQATAEIVHDRLPPKTELVDLGRHKLRGLSRLENVFALRAIGQANPAQELVLDAPPTAVTGPDAVGPVPAAAIAPLPAPLTRTPPGADHTTRDDHAIVGRDDEIARLGDFLDSARRGPTALVLDGQAGIGKTTLWRWTLATAQGRGFTVLSASPAAAEAALSFAALNDLLESVLGEVLPRLPLPRRSALEAALLLSTSEEGPPQVYAIAAAVRDVLRILGERGPVLVAVDDAHWVDRPSAAVVAYAVRRLGTAPVAVLAARRSDAGTGVPFELDRAVDSCDRMAVAELSLGALHRIIARRLDLTLPRPLLRRIAEAAGGNPFFALEIARALQRHGAMPNLADTVPVPGELHGLMRERLLALPADTRELLAAAAALAAPTTSLLEAATGSGPAALRTAIDAGVLSFEGERLRFTHPLVRSAALALFLPAERRALHGRLSTVAPDPEERARQLALSAEGPDSAVAHSLDEAARVASQRGAGHTAAELCELALHLTPRDAADDAHERRLRALRYTWEAGDADRARELGEEAVAAARPGPRRARALVELAVLLSSQADVRAANGLQRRALEEAGDELDVRAAAHAELAINLFLLRESLPEAEKHAHLAVALAEQLESPARLTRCLTNQGIVRMCLGRADAEQSIIRALDLEKRLPDPAGLPRGPRWDYACALLWSDRLTEAANAFNAVLDHANAVGDDGLIPYTLAHLALTHCLAGELGEAAAVAAEGHALSIQAGLASEQAMLLAVRAFVAAHQGDADSCRALAVEAISAGKRRSLKVAVITGHSAIALLELSHGAHARIVEELAQLERELTAAGVGNPGGLRFLPDYTEALVALRDLDHAQAVIGRYEAHAARLDRSTARASALRCRGLIDVARGDVDGALRAFSLALEQHDRLVLPIDRARTLLAQGAVFRRAKQTHAARAALEEALAGFATAGAQVFADATEHELSLIGGRTASPGG
jgi:DNA-binding SARP family transcriptional activator/class 3 adenylate cyclase/predicted ATPase